MLAKNEHIRKEHSPKPWSMDFLGDSLIYSRKIIMINMQQNLYFKFRNNVATKFENATKFKIFDLIWLLKITKISIY